MAYFANTGPARGPYLWKDANAAIGVLKARDKLMPIGMATSTGPDGAGLALWRLTIGGVEQPGLWRVVDREFRSAE